MPPPLSRREILARLSFLFVVAPIAGCTGALSQADADLRLRTLHYVDRSPNPKQTCSGCQQFKSHGKDQCGGCVVVRGPVSPAGRCSQWAAKPV
jgi:hypothetical protein